MKIHPVVGAEILERVQFPYPVVPDRPRASRKMGRHAAIRTALRAKTFPSARGFWRRWIAWTRWPRDRQYRRALPLDEAMKIVSSESGKAFDPSVVEVLSRRYVELEQMAQSQATTSMGKLSTERQDRARRSARGGLRRRPRPGRRSDTARTAPVDFLTSIAAARQEVQALFEISQDLGNSLSLDETLSRAGRAAAQDHPASLAGHLGPPRERAACRITSRGDDFRLFSSLEIPVGQGLSGWVAENRKPILNGNPSVEPGYLNDPAQVLDAALRRRGAARRRERRAGRADAVSRRARRVHQGSSADPAGDQLQDRHVDRERPALPPGGIVGDHGFPDQPAQRAVAVPATGFRTVARPARQSAAGGAGAGSGRIQAGERPVRAPGRQQGAARGGDRA